MRFPDWFDLAVLGRISWITRRRISHAFGIGIEPVAYTLKLATSWSRSDAGETVHANGEQLHGWLRRLAQSGLNFKAVSEAD